MTGTRPREARNPWKRTPRAATSGPRTTTRSTTTCPPGAGRRRAPIPRSTGRTWSAAPSGWRCCWATDRDRPARWGSLALEAGGFERAVRVDVRTGPPREAVLEFEQVADWLLHLGTHAVPAGEGLRYRDHGVTEVDDVGHLQPHRPDLTPLIPVAAQTLDTSVDRALAGHPLRHLGGPVDLGMRQLRVRLEVIAIPCVEAPANSVDVLP